MRGFAYLLPGYFREKAIVDRFQIVVAVPWEKTLLLPKLLYLREHPEEIDELNLTDCSKRAVRLFSGEPFVALARPVDDYTLAYPDKDGQVRAFIQIEAAVVRCESI